MDTWPKLPADASPTQRCASAVCRLAMIWNEIGARPGMQGTGDFVEEIFGGIWRDGNRGDTFEAELDRWDEKPEDMKSLGLLQAIFTCTAYAAQGIKSDADGDTITAWQYTARCKYWLGIVVGSWSNRSTQSEPATQFARLGADARHTENRAMKAYALEWYAANADKVRSKDAAAEAIAGKVVPVTFRTVRDWLKGA